MVGLIGRVVPIKDVKTFLRAMRGVISAMPQAEGWIVGPEEEDPEYVSECRSLMASLGLEGKVHFLGFQRIQDILPKLGLMVLTSISEAQPLVILEAWAAGTPVVSSDVGSCRELIEGGSAEDRDLGTGRQSGGDCRPASHQRGDPRTAAQPATLAGRTGQRLVAGHSLLHRSLDAAALSRLVSSRHGEQLNGRDWLRTAQDPFARFLHRDLARLRLRRADQFRARGCCRSSA